jgi:hypothetical protein
VNRVAVVQYSVALSAFLGGPTPVAFWLSSAVVVPIAATSCEQGIIKTRFSLDYEGSCGDF